MVLTEDMLDWHTSCGRSVVSGKLPWHYHPSCTIPPGLVLPGVTGHLAYPEPLRENVALILSLIVKYVVIVFFVLWKIKKVALIYNATLMLHMV